MEDPESCLPRTGRVVAVAAAPVAEESLSLSLAASAFLPRFLVLRLRITSLFSDSGRIVPCSFWNRPHALHMVLPCASRRQSGVLNVLQLKHCTWGFFGSSGTEFWRYEDSDEDESGLVIEFLRTEFAVVECASGSPPSSAIAALVNCEDDRLVGSVGRKAAADTLPGASSASSALGDANSGCCEPGSEWNGAPSRWLQLCEAAGVPALKVPAKAPPPP